MVSNKLTKLLSLIMVSVLPCLVLSSCGSIDFAQQQSLRLEKVEGRYRQNLEDWINDAQPPSNRYSGEMFVSWKTVNELLQIIKGREFPITADGKNCFAVRDVKVENTHKIPTVFLDGETKSTQFPDIHLAARAAAYVIPEEVDGSGTFKLKLALVDISPTINVWKHDTKILNFVKDILHAKSQEYLEALPPIETCLRKQVEATLAASTKSQRIPIRGDDTWIDGNLQVPGLKIVLTLSAQKIILLDDGIHLFVGVNSKVGETEGNGSIEQVMDQAYVGLPPARKIELLEHRDADLLFTLNKGVLKGISSAFSNLPDAQKQVSFKSTSQTGNFLDERWHELRLEHADGLNATLIPSKIEPSFPPDALMNVSITGKVSARTQVHLHSRPGIGRFRPGGGVGSTIGVAVPVQLAKINAKVAVENSPAGAPSFHLKVNLTSPPSIPVPFRVGLGALGWRSFAITAPLPLGELYVTDFPSFYADRGQVTAFGKAVNYSLTVGDSCITQTPQAITLKTHESLTFPAQ